MRFILSLRLALKFYNLEASTPRKEQTELKTKICDQCGKYFKSSFGLYLHRKNKHIKNADIHMILVAKVTVRQFNSTFILTLFDDTLFLCNFLQIHLFFCFFRNTLEHHCGSENKMQKLTVNISNKAPFKLVTINFCCAITV